MTDSRPDRPPVHLLIAGCGYLGQRVAAHFQQRGIRVSVLTRTHSKAEQLTLQGYFPVVADLATGPLPVLPDVDTVLWSVGFDRSSGQAREAIWIDGLQRLLQALPQTVRRFLYVSSTGVYGQTDGETVSESTPPCPTTASGRCCLQAEQLLQDFWNGTSSPAALSILRLAGIYGPDRLLRRTTDLQAGTVVPGSGDSWLNLIHVDDAVAAIAQLAPRTDIPLLNVVNSDTLTRGDYYRELARLVDAPAPVFDTTASTTRGGNKRVISDVRQTLAPDFRYDDVRHGLRQAAAD